MKDPVRRAAIIKIAIIFVFLLSAIVIGALVFLVWPT